MVVEHTEPEEFLPVAFMLVVTETVVVLQEELCTQQDGVWDLDQQWG